MKVRHYLAVGGIAALVLAGCGGGDDDDGGNDASVTVITAKDRSAIEGVGDEIEKAAKTRNGKALCKLVQPGLVDEAFGSFAKCIKQTSKSLGQPQLKNVQVETITPTSTGASVAFKNAPDGIPFVKIDGQWYLDVSSSVDPSKIPSAD